MNPGKVSGPRSRTTATMEAISSSLPVRSCKLSAKSSGRRSTPSKVSMNIEYFVSLFSTFRHLVSDFLSQFILWRRSARADGAGLCPELRVHFNSKGAPGDVIGGEHDFVLSGSVREVTLTMKCSEIYVSTPNVGEVARKYRVAAELTQIPVARMYTLTGSGLTTPLI